MVRTDASTVYEFCLISQAPTVFFLLYVFAHFSFTHSTDRIEPFLAETLSHLTYGVADPLARFSFLTTRITI